MSVKQERPDVVYPPPPPLLAHGVRQPVYGPPSTDRPPLSYCETSSNASSAQSASNNPIEQTSSRESPGSAKDNSQEDMTHRIDSASIKGTFGWETVDNANIPCIFREGDKYVSVRMVEQKLLSKYPSTYPDELRNRPPLMSQFITTPEAKLLNEINIEHCACEYGQRSFTEKDLVVRLKDFIEFYQIVRKHFPNEMVATDKVTRPTDSSGGGWVQVNNTVVPYIRRPTPSVKEILNLAPLPVIKYAAGLLTNTDVPSLEPTDEECKLLSDMCKSAGLDFNFSHNTPLILLQQLPVYCSTKVIIKRLPDDDPFGNAEYCPEFDTQDYKFIPGTTAVQGVMLPTMQDLSPQQSSQLRQAPPPYPYLTGPPNVTVQPGSSVPFSKNNHVKYSQGHKSEVVSGGPQRKRSRSSASPIEDLRRTSNGKQRSSPIQNGVPSSIYPGIIPGQMPAAVPAYGPGIQAFPVRPGSNLALMSHANLVHGSQRAAWQPGLNSRPHMMPGVMPHSNQQPPLLAQYQRADQSSPKLRNHQASPSATSTVTSQNNTPVNSQPQNKSSKSSAPKRNHVEKIQPVDFHGKKISCLIKGPNNERYALIEAISRVYYPQCTLAQFIRVMTDTFHVPIDQLDREEEKAFISFYGLPTSSLKCNKVLKLSSLDPIMPHLKQLLRKKEDGASVKARTSATPPVQHAASTSVSNDNNNNNSSNPTGVSPGQIQLPPVNPFQPPAKRPSSGSSSGSNKFSKLEDAVNRLRQKKLKEPEESTSTAGDPLSQNSSVNQLGQGQIPRNPFTKQ